MRGLFWILFVLLFWGNACSNKDNSRDIKGKPIVLKPTVKINWVGHWQNEGFKEQLIYDLARKFEFENQDIELNIQFPGDLYPDKTDNSFSIAEFEKPQADWDILRINNEISGIAALTGDPQWPSKYLVDFKDNPEFRKNSAEVVTSAEMIERWSGIVPGPAIDAHSFVLWCNKEIASKIGINLKQFEISTDDFEGYFRALSNYNQQNNTKIYALTFNDGWFPTLTLAQQLFASILGDYDKIKDLSFSEEKLKAWETVLQYCEKLAQYKLIDPNWKSYAYGSDYSKPLSGETLFMINGTWMFNIWQTMDSVNYKKMIPLELPTFKPATTYIGEVSIPWVIPKNTAHKDEAVRVLMFWCRPEVADEWVRNTKSPTGIKGNLVQSTFGFDDYETFDYTISKNYNGKKLPFNYGNNALFFGAKNSTVPNYFTEVMDGSISAKDAMQNIRRKITRN